MSRCSAFAAAVSIIGLLTMQSAASAAPITVDFTVKGALQSFGSNNGAFNAAPGNVLVGRTSQSTARNYFVFNLAGVTDTVLTAQLVIQSPFRSYISSDLTETYALFDYTSDIGILQNQASSSTAAYDDLGTGDDYGSTIVSSAQDGIANGPDFPVIINLTPAAVADLNAGRGGLFAVGGAITTISGNSTQSFFAFSGNGDNAQLILNPIVPEPTAALAVVGLLIGSCRRRC